MSLTSDAPQMDAAARARKALARVAQFAALPANIQDDMAGHAQPRAFNAGQVIYLEGEPATALYVIESGWVKGIRLSPEGREQTLQILGPGEIFGDVAVFNEAPYPGTAVALEPVTAWAVERSAALMLVSRHPELALAMIRRLGQRVLHYIGLVEDLSLRSVEARLAHTLLIHAEQHGDRLVVARRAWATLDEMAGRLGTVRDVLSRSLRALEADGLIRVQRREVVILDLAGLTERSRRSGQGLR